MEKGNTLFYHGHILTNIDKLDVRKDSFIGHRLEFLQERCLPVRKKIEMIKQEINVFKKMRDTQFEVIESQPTIAALKAEISEYIKTHVYYESKLDEYDRMTGEIQQRNEKVKKVLMAKRAKLKAIALKNSESHNKEPKQKSLFGEYSRFGTTIGNDQTYEQLASNPEKSIEMLEDSNHLKLPQIANSIRIKRNPHKYYAFDQKKNIRHHLQNFKNINEFIDHQEQVSRIAKNQRSEEAELSSSDIKILISQFDKTESLFHQCFERKKLAIQKSVSQLQSKLITNKEVFLNACYVIGEKKGEISFEEFSELTSDQLITLFISFGWLNRKIYGDFAKKRKNIINVLNKAKSLENARS